MLLSRAFAQAMRLDHASGGRDQPPDRDDAYRAECGDFQGVTVTGSEIDYEAVFRILPGSMALLRPDGVILDMNDGFLEAAGRPRHEILGRNLFEAFPASIGEAEGEGPEQLRASLESVVKSGERDVMAPLRYDVEDSGRPGQFEERYWVVVNIPVLNEHGEVVMVAHKADEVTHIINQQRNMLADY
jgi:PAS domain-containing protein